MSRRPATVAAVCAAILIFVHATMTLDLHAASRPSPLPPRPGKVMQAQRPPTGFATANVAAQLRCEELVQQLPRPEQFREHLRRITANPHPTGSAAQVEVGRYLVDVMERAGLEVEEFAYDVYLPQLTDDVSAEIVTPEHLPLENREPALAEDRFSGHPELLDGWNAFSGSGDVTGQVVYANFGRKEDYGHLATVGVDLTGKIVVARYGGNFRGYKVKFAEAAGAAGVIMFNDPNPDNADRQYPAGPMMNSSTIQRGSVLTLPWRGDPLTPFEPAWTSDSGKTVERLDPSEVDLHNIPVLPLGYGAASKILELMQGDAAPEEWQGGLPLTYRLTGGDELTVRVRVNQPKALTRATNIVGTIPGYEHPDQWIIFGAHYDPWGFGAIDPNGGTAMLLTMAEALGELSTSGCRPRRSIKIAHWDAEEYGIIGSVEWVEEFRDELMSNAVAYINADSAVSGANFAASAAPSLKLPIIEATMAVGYPQQDQTVYGHWLGRSQDAEETEEPPLGNLGGGSDHVGFYTHAGVPSGSLGMSGAGGVYHSNYDNFAWYERFGDSEFVYGPALARVEAVLALRLANADILPYDLRRYGTDLEQHAIDLEELAESRGQAVELAALKAAAEELVGAAESFVAARNSALANQGSPLTGDVLAGLNKDLLALERMLLHSEGLQDRPWYQSLYASPDPFSGYDSWMLPGLRFEVEVGRLERVAEWETVYVEAIARLRSGIEEATAVLTTPVR